MISKPRDPVINLSFQAQYRRQFWPVPAIPRYPTWTFTNLFVSPTPGLPGTSLPRLKRRPCSVIRAALVFCITGGSEHERRLRAFLTVVPHLPYRAAPVACSFTRHFQHAPPGWTTLTHAIENTPDGHSDTQSIVEQVWSLDILGKGHSPRGDCS